MEFEHSRHVTACSAQETNLKECLYENCFCHFHPQLPLILTIYVDNEKTNLSMSFFPAVNILQLLQKAWLDSDSWGWLVMWDCVILSTLIWGSFVALLVMRTAVRVRRHSVTSEMNIHELRQNDALSYCTIKLCYVRKIWRKRVGYCVFVCTECPSVFIYAQQLHINLHQRPSEDLSCCFYDICGYTLKPVWVESLGFKEIEPRYSLMTNKISLQDLPNSTLIEQLFTSQLTIKKLIQQYIYIPHLLGGYKLILSIWIIFINFTLRDWR